jgi:hypothetical protein
MDAMELKVGVKNTKAFIEANPVRIQLRRPKIEKTSAGGKRRVNPDLIPAQSFRITPMSGLVWDRAKTTPDEGSIPDVTEILIGLPDANIQKGDYFPHEGGWFKIEHVSPLRGYRKEARLSFYNEEPVV